MRYPTQKFFMWQGRTCHINQLFGENKNRLFYGPEGHRGIDFKTTGYWKYKRKNGGWSLIDRTERESRGRIPIVACHAGTVTPVLHDDKQGVGWGVYVTAKPKGDKQYRTLYWHIETPWRSISRFRGVVLSLKQLSAVFTGRKVRKGSIIAIGGNNGKSTGPHLHLALDVREQDRSGRWGQWKRIDPMPHFRDREVICQRYYGPGGEDWYYQGEKITKTNANYLLKTL